MSAMAHINKKLELTSPRYAVQLSIGPHNIFVNTMIDPDVLYFSSEEYGILLDDIGSSIDDEYIEQRAGNSIAACNHGTEVWNNLLKLMDMLHAKSVYELDNKRATIYDLLYWADCFADELHDASLKDNSYLGVRNKCFTRILLVFWPSSVVKSGVT